MVKFTLKYFRSYIIEDNNLYRKPYRRKMKNGNFQYREKRLIKRVFDSNNTEGYILVKNKKRKFYPLSELHFKLKRVD